MKFPWYKYEEQELDRRNTLQIFITNRCNLKCDGCFARNIMGDRKQDMSLKEYGEILLEFIQKGGKQINIIGGEPLLHPDIITMIELNNKFGSLK